MTLRPSQPEKLKTLVAIWERQDKEYRSSRRYRPLPLEAPNAPAGRPKTGTKPARRVDPPTLTYP